MMGIPIRAGFEIVNDGFDLKVFYIARGTVIADGKDVGVSVGRVSEGSLGELTSHPPGRTTLIRFDCSSASVSYIGKEYMCGEYEVLAYAAPPS